MRVQAGLVQTDGRSGRHLGRDRTGTAQGSSERILAEFIRYSLRKDRATPKPSRHELQEGRPVGASRTSMADGVDARCAIRPIQQLRDGRLVDVQEKQWLNDKADGEPLQPPARSLSMRHAESVPHNTLQIAKSSFWVGRTQTEPP